MNDDSSSSDSDYIDYRVDEDGESTSTDETGTSSSNDELVCLCTARTVRDRLVSCCV
jgi:hypothetical protein